MASGDQGLSLLQSYSFGKKSLGRGITSNTNTNTNTNKNTNTNTNTPTDNEDVYISRSHREMDELSRKKKRKSGSGANDSGNANNNTSYRHSLLYEPEVDYMENEVVGESVFNAIKTNNTNTNNTNTNTNEVSVEGEGVEGRNRSFPYSNVSYANPSGRRRSTVIGTSVIAPNYNHNKTRRNSLFNPLVSAMSNTSEGNTSEASAMAVNRRNSSLNQSRSSPLSYAFSQSVSPATRSNSNYVYTQKEQQDLAEHADNLKIAMMEGAARRRSVSNRTSPSLRRASISNMRRMSSARASTSTSGPSELSLTYNPQGSSDSPTASLTTPPSSKQSTTATDPFITKSNNKSHKNHSFNMDMFEPAHFEDQETLELPMSPRTTPRSAMETSPRTSPHTSPRTSAQESPHRTNTHITTNFA
ncbi:hypothetical protein ACO0QE_002544 [Hanseniaspora vineae]